MARGINKVILVGNLGDDPETRYSPNNTAVTKIRLATNESWRDKDSGEQKERTEWHRVVFFGRLAEIAGEYLRKGRQVYVEGSLRTNKWQDRDGNDRYTTEVVASEMQMLGGRDGGPPMSGGGSSRPAGGGSGGSSGGGSKSSGGDSSGGSSGGDSGAGGSSGGADFDDDIPF